MKATAGAMTNAVLVGVLMLANVSWSRAQWPTAHGSPANTGFARVDTLPATFQSQIGYADVGHVAPGANPVTGPDGTVYIGNLGGELIALHADGTPYWKRKINPEHGGIFSSPAVGADGSIYAVSSYRDGATGLHASFLHRFSPGGGWVFWRPFPKAKVYPFTDGGAASAPPNIWEWNGTEAIMTPVLYKGLGRSELRLIAFSTAGAVLGDRQVTVNVYDITSSSGIFDGIIDFFDDCFSEFPPACNFSAHFPMAFSEAGWPQPGVAIWEYPQGSPYIWVADGLRSTVAYKFEPATGFSEIYRFSDTKDRLSSPPVALDNVIAAVGTEDGRLKFERDNFFIALPGPITAPPTRMADGRLVVISRSGTMSVVNSHTVVQQQPLNGASIAPAAASCTHLFVSSTDEFTTFEVKTMTPVARIPWTDGGRNAPVIGPFGHVYGMTNFGLFVFAPPPRLPIATFRAFGTACDRVVWNPGGVLLP